MEPKWHNQWIIKSISELEEKAVSNVKEALEIEKKIKHLKFEYNTENSNKSWLPVISFIAISIVISIYKPLVIFSILVSDVLLARIHQHIMKTL
jgi:hypothetical protein